MKLEFSDLEMVKFSDLPSPGVVSRLLKSGTMLNSEAKDTLPDEAPRYLLRHIPGTLVPWHPVKR